MNILVIGNGFDLAHKLPTQYWDFLIFIKAIKMINVGSWEGNVEKFSNELTQLGINKDVKRYILDKVFLESSSTEIRNELVELVNENIWIDYFLDCCYKKCKYKGWIDFESEISNVIKNLDYSKQFRLKSQNEIPNDIEDKIIEIINHYRKLNGLDEIVWLESIDNEDYYEDIVKVLENDLDKLIRLLEIYLSDLVENIHLEIRIPEITKLKIDKVLSFNYTNTYERLYHFDTNTSEYDYIHGKAEGSRRIQDNNMVVGIDEYLDENRKNSDVTFIKFKKYFQRIHKQTGSQYKEWLSHIKNTRSIIGNHIYFFGHSLDVTDKDILNELIKCENVVITIFYLNKKVYAQQIANLVKVIGCDELIERVSKPNPKIIFEQQESIS